MYHVLKINVFTLAIPDIALYSLIKEKVCLFQFVIMVIDSTDRQRLSISREELHRMLTHEELSKACLLVFANKQVKVI